MTDTPPTSVLLPTVRWTDACDEVAEQLGPDDELLVVADTAGDRVVDRAERDEGLPDGVQVVLAGEPVDCSGKANAIATGMEAAANDRIVWTDDDFHHPPDWLEGLHADYERQGATTERPAFVGRDPLGVLLEPAYLVGGTIPVAVGGIVWGGAVVFERDDIDEGAFLADLRRALSDDGALTEHLDVTAADRTRVVPAGGSVRESLERFVRFLWIARYYAPRATALNVALAAVLAVACLVAPLPTVGLLTVVSAATYAWAGLHRPTFLLAAPGVLVAPVLLSYALGRQTFVWAGRRYRWRAMYEVEVRDP
ncbi:MAG: glycosyltransferase [Halorubrum sp.]